jgi:DUF2950 family protein/uncharacterized protein DUF6869
MPRNLDRLAALYLRRDKSRASQTAFSIVWDLVHNDSEQAWWFILVTLAQATDDRDLAYLAAGPLEDLLKLHGSSFIIRIETRARQDERMLRALSGVRLTSEDAVFPQWHAMMEKHGFIGGDGKMTKGFAMIASPSKYGASGIMTFIVGKDGKVFQKDLGENTSADVAGMTEFNPDKSWSEVKE